MHDDQHNSLEADVGIGQGFGVTGSVDIGANTIAGSLRDSANYFEVRLNNGKISVGQSLSQEAYINILASDLGIANNEQSDWDGNWSPSESSFVGVRMPDSIGVGGAVYFIVGGSANARINLEKLFNSLSVDSDK